MNFFCIFYSIYLFFSYIFLIALSLSKELIKEKIGKKNFHFPFSFLPKQNTIYGLDQSFKSPMVDQKLSYKRRLDLANSVIEVSIKCIERYYVHGTKWRFQKHK